MEKILLTALKERIVDWYLTKRTGKDKSTREWEAWYNENVVWRADTIPNMFKNFEHVIEVDWRKFITDGGMGCWVPVESARQYFWPQRELGSNCVWRMERVIWDKWDRCWHINGLGDEDKIFVATNDERDAMMIALKYGG